MHLPQPTASHSERVRFGRYTITRLKRGRLFPNLVTELEACNAAVKSAGRAVEDAAEPVQDCLAARDAADDDGDAVAQDARLKLASRAVDAARKPPYTAVFPEGMDHYIVTPVDKQPERYRELKLRLDTHLPAADEVRTALAPKLETAAAAYAEAMVVLAEARGRHALARTALESAEEAWERMMEKAYGALVAEVGKKAADRYFPRRQRRSATEDAGETG